MYHDYLILGGAGLVGLQVCRHIIMRLEPRRIIVASLKQHEAEEACAKLEKEFGDKVAFVPDSGNLFVPTTLSQTSRNDLLSDTKTRHELLCALYDSFENAYEKNHLVHVIRRHRPEVIA